MERDMTKLWDGVEDSSEGKIGRRGEGSKGMWQGATKAKEAEFRN
jgi:hypothetical protein